MAILSDNNAATFVPGMLVAGVTGGIGSGKSVVCGFLQERGARVFDADRAGKELLATDPGAREEIVREFGAPSYRSDGSLDRTYVANIAFNDAEKLSAINAIVHPRVFAAFDRARTDARADGVRLLIHEAALLFEAGGDRYVDTTVYVDAPRWLRIQRVRDQRHMTRREVMSRMEHQLPAYRGRKRADFVVRNDGSLEQLEMRVDQLIHRFEQKYGLQLIDR